MFPIILERDTPIVDWRTGLAGWATDATSTQGEIYSVVSDGLLHADYGTMYIAQPAGPTAGKCECAGLHITQPETLDEFTPYAISVVAMSEDPLTWPFLFIGISPATITSDATGDVLSKCRIIGVADNIDAPGACMEKEVTIVVAKMPVGLEARALCVGVGMTAGTVNSADKHCWAYLSVRRLVGNNPPIIDTRKL